MQYMNIIVALFVCINASISELIEGIELIFYYG